MDESDGKARLHNSQASRNAAIFVWEIDPIDLPANQEAAAACPVNIIKVSS